MIGIKVRDVQFLFLFLYLFFLSFLNFTPFYLVSAIFLCGFTVLKIITTKKIRVTKYIVFELLFVLYNVLYIVLDWTINASLTIDVIKTLCLNLVINLFIINTIGNKKDLRRVLNWFVGIASFSSIYAILYSKGDGIAGRLCHGLERPFGSTTYTSMEFASWAAYAGTIALFQYLQTKDKKYLIPYPLFWVVIIWSGSRKWILFGVLLQVAVYLVCTKKGNLKTLLKKYAVIGSVLVLGIFLIFNNSTLYDIVGSRFIGFLDGSESSASSREYLQKTALMYIGENPLRGYGIGTFKEVNQYENWSEVNYLEIAFSGGIPLLIFYYGFMIQLLISLYKIRKKDKLYVLMFFILLMIIVSDTVSMSYLQRLEQFLIAMCSLTLNFNKKEEKQKMCTVEGNEL